MAWRDYSLSERFREMSVVAVICGVIYPGSAFSLSCARPDLSRAVLDQQGGRIMVGQIKSLESGRANFDGWLVGASENESTPSQILLQKRKIGPWVPADPELNRDLILLVQFNKKKAYLELSPCNNTIFPITPSNLGQLGKNMK